MPIQKTARYRVLANLLDTSFGKSSLRNYPNHFVKLSMPAEGTVLVKAQMIVSVGSVNVFNELRKKYREELLETIKRKLEEVQKQYKAAIEAAENVQQPTVQKIEEAPPKTVRLVLDSKTLQEWLEDIRVSGYTTQKTCIFHIQCLAEVE